jgi:hypothetical protein
LEISPPLLILAASSMRILIVSMAPRAVDGFVSRGGGAAAGGGGFQEVAFVKSHPNKMTTTTVSKPSPPSRVAVVSSSSTTTSTCLQAMSSSIDTRFMWNAGLSFGKGEFAFYVSFDRFMSPFPQQDKDANPDLFNLPKGVYEVALPKPLGIVFEEIEQGRGLYVKELVEGGNAEGLGGMIKPGDVLVGMTAIKIVGAKYERRLIPAFGFDFDTMVGAVESNAPKFGCDDVVLMFEQPDVANSQEVQSFMAFFEPPFDNPWKQRQ